MFTFSPNKSGGVYVKELSANISAIGAMYLTDPNICYQFYKELLSHLKSRQQPNGKPKFRSVDNT